MSRHPLQQLREVLGTLEESSRSAGNLADAYCDLADIPAGVEPWSELIAERNVLAHYVPDDISDERVWSDTAGDVEDLRQQVEQAARAIGLAR